MFLTILVSKTISIYNIQKHSHFQACIFDSFKIVISYIQRLHERANGYETLPNGNKYWQDPPNKPYLKKSKTLKFFQSATYDKGIEDGLDEEIAFKDAQYEGDWDWKKDADGIIFYDRRYKKLKLV